MLDFHTHLLPGVDDGATTLEQSLQLLDELEKNGFDSVVLSPHFYPYKEPAADFVKRRDAAFEQLKSSYTGNLKLYAGCECYLHEYIFHIEDIKPLCAQGTKYLMLELSYRRGDGQIMLKLIDRLLSVYNVNPVLAHLERYPYITGSEKFFGEFLELGCTAQVNLQSFAFFWGRKKLADYLQKGYIRFVGTDTHRAFDQKNFEKAQKYLTDQDLLSCKAFKTTI